MDDVLLVVRYILSLFCFWSFLLCFIYKSVNQTFVLLLIRLIEICSYFVLILPCFCFVYVSVLLFASSGKLENQKTVLTNIASMVR